MTDKKSLFPRSSGVLLHPTSLPGRYGIGDLGKYAYQFVDWLADAGQTAWQVLPLGPTSFGDSPYQTLSAFAGNPNLISLDKLEKMGWLSKKDLETVPDFPVYEVDYGPVIDYHNLMLGQAFENFEDQADPKQHADYEAWVQSQADWLDDYALFAALKDANGGRPWTEWDEPLALRHPDALDAARKTLGKSIREKCFRQWCFFTQWAELRAYARSKDVRFIGDIPIFVAHDSADVWQSRDLYFLDPKGMPTVVAGVPPDYFSPTGQYWGNPLYNWEIHRKTGYAWWIKRMQAIFELVDIVRVDHFRGFAAYWEVPVNAERTAVDGQWMPGPGADFFNVVGAALNGDAGLQAGLPIIAEDLGDITKDVIELRDQFNLPGMKILQFAWSDPGNPFLPHNYVPNCFAYSGTHDNNTTLGWWHQEAHNGIKQFMHEYLGQEVSENDIHWTFIRLGMASVAHTYVTPLQDVFGFGADTRMNTPGKLGGNWGWRFTEDWFEKPAKERLLYLTRLYKRLPTQQVEVYGDVATGGKDKDAKAKA